MRGNLPLPLVAVENFGFCSVMDVTRLVQSDLEERSEFRAKEYGTRLMTWSGRDALWDAYEEALDLCLYLRQLIEERKNIDDLMNGSWDGGDLEG